MLENAQQEAKLNIKPKSLTAKEWELHYRGWEKTSLSKAAYCRKHALAKDNFYYWCQRKPSR